MAQRYPGFYRNEIKTSVIQPINLLTPAIEVSYERYYRKNLSTELTIGKIIHHPMPGETDYTNMKGIKLATETKWLETAEETRRRRRYIAAELVYINQTYNAVRNFSDTPWPDENPYADSISVKRYSVGLNFKIGFKVRFSHFIMDIGGGVGLRYIDSKHVDRINPDSEAVNGRHFNIWDSFIQEGKRVGVTLPMTIKVGYTF